MRLLAVIFMIFAAMPARAAELSWFRGAPDVSLGQDSYSERIKQAEMNGLSWSSIPLEVPLELVQDITLAERPKEMSVIPAVRWVAPQKVPFDIVAFGIDRDLPFPRAEALSIINWANNQGGASIISNGRLADLGEEIQTGGPIAFAAYSRERWHPDVTPGSEWDSQLAFGRKIFIVGSASPGMVVLGNDSAATDVLAQKADTSSIADAIRAGRCAVSEHGVIKLDFRVNGNLTGSTIVPQGDVVEVSVGVDSAEEVSEVIIYGNVVRLENSRLKARTEAIKTIPVNAKKLFVRVEVPVHKSTGYLRAVAVSRTANVRTLSNPVFIRAEKEEDTISFNERRRKTIEVMLRKINWSWTDASEIIGTILSNEDIAPTAAVIMSKTFGRKEIDVIKKLLDSPRPLVRAHAAYIILKVGGDDGLEAIMKLLDSNELESRLYAAQILALHAKPALIDRALWLAKDESMQAKHYAYIALAKIPRLESIRALRQAGISAAGTENAAFVMACVGECLKLRPKRKDVFYQDFISGKLDADFAKYMVGREEMLEHVLSVASNASAEPAKEQEKKDAPKYREVVAKWTNVRPKIDGELDRAIWDKINAMSDFKTDKGVLAKQKTSFGILYDEYAMYIFIDCTEPEMQSLVARHGLPDEDVFEDDSISIYISPTNDRTAPAKYFRFSANSLSVRMEEEGTRRKWNADWAAASARGPERWTLEITIPFKTVGVNPVRSTNEWLINVVRHRRAGEPEESLLQPCDPKDSTGNAILKFQNPMN